MRGERRDPRTAVELFKDGSKRVFHRRGKKAWTHHLREACEVCDGKDKDTTGTASRDS